MKRAVLPPASRAWPDIEKLLVALREAGVVPH